VTGAPLTRLKNVRACIPVRVCPTVTLSIRLSEIVILMVPVAALYVPSSAAPIMVGRLAFGGETFPYSNDGAPVASVFIAT